MNLISSITEEEGFLLMDSLANTEELEIFNTVAI
jgi:hypothetical protein